MILLLHGEDSYRLHQRLKEIIQTKREQYSSKLSLFDIDCTQRQNKITIDTFLVPSFLGENRLVILRHFFKTDFEANETIQILSKLITSGVEIIFFEKGKVSKDNTLFSFIKHRGKIEEYPLLEDLTLEGWIMNEARRYKLTLTPEVISQLKLQCVNDTWCLHNRLIQLATYSKEKIIKKWHFEKLYGDYLGEETAFLLLDSLLNDQAKALEILLKRLKAGDSPFSLLAFLTSYLRKQILIAEKLNRGLSVQKTATLLGMHPYIIEKTKSQLRSVSLDSLKKIYRRLMAVDRMVKSGKEEAETALQLFILSLV